MSRTIFGGATAAAGFTAPAPAAGQYAFTASPAAAATSSSLLDDTLRLTAWLVPRAITIDRIGVEVTAAGAVGRRFRPAIYADSGAAYPGAPLVDPGQVSVEAIGNAVATIAVTLPAGLYWVGGAVQVAGGTAPTIRTVATSWVPPVLLPLGTTAPAANTLGLGYQQSSVAGALPTFTGTTVTTLVPRVFVRLA